MLRHSYKASITVLFYVIIPFFYKDIQNHADRQRSRSRIEIPTSTQRSRNRAVVISRPLFACFFNVNLGYEIISPELQNFRKNLLDGKHLEILKPFINGSRNGWVRVPCHDVGDVL